MTTYTNEEAAKQIGVPIATLYRYIKSGKVKPPPLQALGRMKVRAWSARDIDRAKKQIPKIRYRHIGKGKTKTRRR